MSFFDEIPTGNPVIESDLEEQKNYSLSNSGNIDDLLQEFNEPVQEYEHNESAAEMFAEPEDEPEPVSSRFADAQSTFLIGCLDKLQSELFGAIAGNKEADFSFEDTDKKELKKYADVMLEGKKTMPPWAMFSITLLMILAVNTKNAFAIRKETQKRIEAEAEAERLRKENEELKAEKDQTADHAHS